MAPAVPAGEPRPGAPDDFLLENQAMKQIRQTADVQEAMGIVISDGAKVEVSPRFAAFVWAPGPEPIAATEATEPRAA
jgi:hypothetical protein